MKRERCVGRYRLSRANVSFAWVLVCLGGLNVHADPLSDARTKYFDFLVSNPSSSASARKEKFDEYEAARKQANGESYATFSRAVRDNLAEELKKKGKLKQKGAAPSQVPLVSSSPLPSASSAMGSGRKADRKAPVVDSKATGRESVVIDPNQVPSVLDFSGSSSSGSEDSVEPGGSSNAPTKKD